MRLVTWNDQDQLTIVEVFGKNVPPYAILSHTWSGVSDEVSFRDMIEGSGKQKIGHLKLQFCKAQATRDNLKYFWMDTCCINKSSDAELSEAIRSMFRWYQKAVKCYVYLSDVSPYTDHTLPIWNQQLQEDFVKSRWFTRGWTLQELLAPASVEFFSADGRLLGEKQSLEQLIHIITGIPVRALREGDLNTFSVDERLGWAAQRETTREEDLAYCLFGLFGIHIPVLYGEGSDNAFHRLMEAAEKITSQQKPEQAFEAEINQKENYVANIETKLAALAADNERLKIALSRALRENETLRATIPAATTVEGLHHHEPDQNIDGNLSSLHALASSQSDFHDGKDMLLTSSATWDLINNDPLVQQGIADIADICYKLRGAGRIDESGPVFVASTVRRAIWESSQRHGDKIS